MKKDRMLLGIDLGTSSVKLCLMNDQGTSCQVVKAEYPMIGTENGLYEQRPEDWLRAIAGAAKMIISPEVGERICAIGFSAQMPTLVVSTPDGAPLNNAIVWCDPRAEDQGKELLKLWGEERHYKQTGIVLDGRYIITMARWLSENSGVDFSKDYKLLSAKDYLCLKFTGNAVTDPSTASGFGVYSIQSGDWDGELCSEAQLDVKHLPEIRDSAAVAGSLSEDAANLLGIRPGTPVITGCADSVCGVLGMGAQKSGTACQMWGSGTAIILVTERPVYSPERRYFITPLARPETYGAEADILSTGAGAEWFYKLMGTQIFEAARKAPSGSEDLLFYPYLSGGEQGVLWDSELQGGILGLNTRHGPEHIARGLLEGMCFEVRRCIEAFQKGGCHFSESLCTGPFSREPFFMQMLADILSAPCSAVYEENSSALGAAYIAGIGVGVWKFEDIMMMAAGGGKTYTPNNDKTTAYNQYYERYIKNTGKIKPIEK